MKIQETDLEQTSGSNRRKTRQRHRRLRWLIEGLVLGAMTGHALSDLGVKAIPILRTLDIVLILAAVCPFLMLTRVRKAIYAASALAAVSYLIVAYTPAFRGPIHRKPRIDPLQQADAVVVLSSSMHDYGDIPAEQEQRLLHAFAVLKNRYAPRLVITRLPDPAPSAIHSVQQQLELFGIDAPVLETQVVLNTHDEALEVRNMIQREGWKRIILITSLLHMRRAAAAFEKAGVAVIASPCTETTFDLRALRPGRDRVTAFRNWLWEEIGWYTYRLRGWV